MSVLQNNANVRDDATFSTTLRVETEDENVVADHPAGTAPTLQLVPPDVVSYIQRVLFPLAHRLRGNTNRICHIFLRDIQLSAVLTESG